MKTPTTHGTMDSITGLERGLPRRFVTPPRAGLRLLPAALVLATAIAAVPGAGATGGGCTPRSNNLIANGGNSRNETNIDVSADGGFADADASGGDDNFAFTIFGIARAGNGGEADSDANGGNVSIGNVNSGNNRGNAIGVRSSGGSGRGSCGGGNNAVINGGNSVNETNISVSADGGVANADASGGDDNVAVGAVGIAEAGNGGEANASANGGTVVIGDVNSGGNSGNEIDVD